VLGIAVAGTLLAARRSLARGAEILALFAAAGLVSGLLFLPVLDDVRAYFDERDYSEPPLGWFGVPVLLAGGRVAAVLWLAALPLALAGLWRERRVVAILAAAAILGPAVVLVATLPPGMDFAYSRYLASALPAWIVLLAWAPVVLARRVFRDGARADRAALAVALGSLATSHLCGPLGPFRPREGAFANTYLALQELPAFDAPFPDLPAFYRELGADPSPARIVETPPIYTRAVLLYRNYALQHGKDVRLGWIGDVPRGVRGRPYVPLLEFDRAEADYVILHRDPLPEVNAYFRYVYEDVWPLIDRPGDASFMKLHEKIYGQNLPSSEATDPVAARLRNLFGPAHYKDQSILVWKLEH
jgi:hypothetical protein